MRKILLGTGCDQPYYPKVRPYLESVERHVGLMFDDKRFIVGVGWNPPSEYGFKALHLPSHLALGDGGISCVQHGAFLHALDADDHDIVIFTDGDIVMQRSFSEVELQWFEQLGDSTVMVGFGGFRSDRTLAEEARSLLPNGRRRVRASRRFIKQHVPERFNLSLPIYNTGVIVATIETYRRLYKRYMQEWPVVDELFEYYSKQQWLLSWLLGSDSTFEVQELPYSFHSHGNKRKSTAPRWCHFKNDVLYYKDDIVLFRHGV